MKKLLLLPLLFSFITSNAQTTAIPDPLFEQELINLGYDTPPIDGQVLTVNINTITSLNVCCNINDLTGIQDFISLTNLDIKLNMLTSLDVTQNIMLDTLDCYGNLLTSLDLSQNLFLTTLNGYYNQLTSLNLSLNTALRFLNVDGNQLNCLNLKNGNNANFLFFASTNNPNLTCIEVDNATFSIANWTIVDPWSTFSTNCPSQCPVGINELTSSSINIHPNPTTRQLTISLEEAKTGVISIRNYLGQLIKQVAFNNTQELNISLNGPSGLYFLQLEVDGQVITKKVVKE